MTISQIIFKKGNFVGDIELDIIITESATATARVTENPVEHGADTNDHIIIEPMAFTTEGVVSNISSTTFGSPSSTNAREAWEALLELQASKVPFTLVQGLKTYDNVVILSLSEAQDKDTSNGLFFTSAMKEINLVGTDAPTEDQFDDADIADKMVPTISGGLKQLEVAE